MKTKIQKYLIVIAGPTAVGKTKVAIEIAKYFDTDIISADSRQIFRELNIGVARPSEEELNTVKHYFIANKSIDEYVSAGTYECEVLELLNTLYQKKDIVVLCGGTGFYTNAVLNGFDEMPEINPEIRNELNEIYKNEGIVPLQEKLRILDIDSYNKMDIKNPQRVIRALEICIGTGKKYSDFKTKKSIERNFMPIKIGLDLPKEILHKNINNRVDKMMEEGFLDEAKSVYEHKKNNALQTVGYKELFDFLDHRTSMEEAVELIKLHTRQYAKRQMTFFKKDKEIQWFAPNEIDNMLQFINIKRLEYF
ncbi:MAG TPA: tRNA (adenosine(37)-N6)-dimethylallyltransferase MiaA [Chitinophagales bacterium]|nr:tRNA (adenosine(37)-N6)-dimethylallyltransferase MiaA [Chitinophagales bacterium]